MPHFWRLLNLALHSFRVMKERTHDGTKLRQAQESQSFQVVSLKRCVASRGVQRLETPALPMRKEALSATFKADLGMTKLSRTIPCLSAINKDAFSLTLIKAYVQSCFLHCFCSLRLWRPFVRVPRHSSLMLFMKEDKNTQMSGSRSMVSAQNISCQ